MLTTICFKKYIPYFIEYSAILNKHTYSLEKKVYKMY